MKPLRSTFATVCAWAWLTIAALLLLDTALNGRDKASVIAAAVLLFTCGAAYAFGLRPKVTADDAAVTVTNPFRTTRIPWSSVKSLSGTRALTIACDQGETTSWAVQASPRAQRKNDRKKPDPALPAAVTEKLRTATPVTFAIEQLTDHRGSGTGPSTTTWSWPALLSLALPAAVFLLALFL
ncbi:hypothetical protein GCM10027589_18090 [Actinocorallia lasiicapitis]